MVKTSMATTIILACLKLDIVRFGGELSPTCSFFFFLKGNIRLLLGPLKCIYVGTVIEENRHMVLQLCMQ